MKKNTCGIVFAIVLLALSGCQGGGSGASAVPVPEVSIASVSSTSPGDGTIDVALEAKIEAAFSIPMDPASFTPASLLLSVDNPGKSQVAASVQYDIASRTATLTPSAPLDSKVDYIATLNDQIHDASGKPLTLFSWKFRTLDNVSPTVLHLNPMCETHNVSPLYEVCAELSESIDPSTVKAETFFLKLLKKGGGGGGVGGGGVKDILVPGSFTFSEDLKSVCFVPNTPLVSDSLFRVTLTNGIHDQSGNPLEGLTCRFDTVETTGPRVVTTVPDQGETEVLRTTLIEATFSEPLDPSSLRADSLVVTDDTGTPIAGSLVYDEVTFRLVFTPDLKLSFQKKYSVEISGTLYDFAGNPMGADFVWDFTTSGPWGDPGFLEQDGATVDDIVFAVHPSGHAYAAWEQQQSGDSKVNIYANHYVPGSGWGNAVRVSQGVTANADAAQLQIDLVSGTVNLVWTQKSAGLNNKNVYISSIPNGDGSWTAPIRLSTDNSAASTPSVVTTLSGVIFVAWTEKAPGETNVNVQVDNDIGGIGWGNRVRISDDSSACANSVISAGSDKVFVTWTQKNPADQKDRVFGSFLSTSSWAAPAQLSSDGKNIFSNPVVLGEPVNGNAVVIWSQQDPTGNDKRNVYVNVFDNSTGSWGQESTISDNQNNSENPQIGMDPSTGNFLAVWEEKAMNDSFRNIQASALDAVTLSWTQQIRVSDDKSDCTVPAIHVNAGGIPFVAWIQLDSDFDTVANIYSSQSIGLFGPWDPKLRASSSSFAVETPKIGSYITGNSTTTIAVWRQRQGAGGSSPRDGRFNLFVQ